MTGIELEDGCQKQHDNPVVMYIFNIYKEIQAKEVCLIGKHHQGGYQEQNIIIRFRKEYGLQDMKSLLNMNIENGKNQ